MATDITTKPNRPDTDVPDAYHEVCHCEYAAPTVVAGVRPPVALCGHVCTLVAPHLGPPPSDHVPCPMCADTDHCPRCGCRAYRPGGA